MTKVKLSPPAIDLIHPLTLPNPYDSPPGPEIQTPVLLPWEKLDPYPSPLEKNPSRGMMETVAIHKGAANPIKASKNGLKSKINSFCTPI